MGLLASRILCGLQIQRVVRLARIELESQLQSRDDEIEFLKRTYEEKIKILMETQVGDYEVGDGTSPDGQIATSVMAQ